MLKQISYILVLVGALNWGLVGLGMFFGQNWNLVSMIFGGIPYLESIIYVLVGAGAVQRIVAR